MKIQKSLVFLWAKPIIEHRQTIILHQLLKTQSSFVSVELWSDSVLASLSNFNSFEEHLPYLINFAQGNFCFDRREQKYVIQLVYFPLCQIFSQVLCVPKQHLNFFQAVYQNKPRCSKYFKGPHSLTGEIEGRREVRVHDFLISFSNKGPFFFFLSTFSVLGCQTSAWSSVQGGTDQTVPIASSLKLTNF